MGRWHWWAAGVSGDLTWRGALCVVWQKRYLVSTFQGTNRFLLQDVRHLVKMRECLSECGTYDVFGHRHYSKLVVRMPLTEGQWPMTFTWSREPAVCCWPVVGRALHTWPLLPSLMTMQTQAVSHTWLSVHHSHVASLWPVGTQQWHLVSNLMALLKITNCWECIFDFTPKIGLTTNSYSWSQKN